MAAAKFIIVVLLLMAVVSTTIADGIISSSSNEDESPLRIVFPREFSNGDDGDAALAYPDDSNSNSEEEEESAAVFSDRLGFPSAPVSSASNEEDHDRSRGLFSSSSSRRRPPPQQQQQMQQSHHDHDDYDYDDNYNYRSGHNNGKKKKHHKGHKPNKKYIRPGWPEHERDHDGWGWKPPHYVKYWQNHHPHSHHHGWPKHPHHHHKKHHGWKMTKKPPLLSPAYLTNLAERLADGVGLLPEYGKDKETHDYHGWHTHKFNNKKYVFKGITLHNGFFTEVL